ncbi:MAG: diaminopimelate decarboxylase [Deltaproteobacteria bacterium]|nr:diaminopimelate decarboxylase [Deltaproteobacteria bacterium]
MNDFAYKEDRLYCGDVAIEDLADSVGTPFYCYSLPTIRRHVRVFEESLAGVDHQTCFAVKANANLAVLAVLANMGIGADVVSGGELFKALKAGMAPSRIVYSGVGKRVDEIDMALAAGILMFNIESEQELEVVATRASVLNKKAPVAIRVNPDVDPETHPYISTGLKENKFGIDIDAALEQYRKAVSFDHVDVIGLDCHIGSQLTEVKPFLDAVERLKVLVSRLEKDGISLRYLDLGGGLGITYEHEEPPHPSEYGSAIVKTAGDLGMKLIFEPGRVIVGNAGILVSRVLYRKRTADKTFIIVDAGMNDLVRPAFYNAYHEISTVVKKNVGREKVDVVGPICESSDFLAKDRELPQLDRGDLIAVMSAGAYGFTMASNYNSRPKPPEILVDKDKFYLVNKRQVYDDLTSGETIPYAILKEGE